MTSSDPDFTRRNSGCPGPPPATQLPGSASSRRQFLRWLAFGAGSAALAACTDGADLTSPTQRSSTTTTAVPGATPATISPSVVTNPEVAVSAIDRSNRTLVVLELNGGNDGLNTVVPYGDGHYYDSRPKLAIPADQTLAIDDHFGMHPELSRIHGHEPAVLTGVGVSALDLSHFEMLRRWWMGDPEGTGSSGTGFFGRCCDQLAGDELVSGVTIDWSPSQALLTERAVTAALPQPDGFQSMGGDDGLYTALRNYLRWSGDGQQGRDGLHGVAARGLRSSIDFLEGLATLAPASDGYPDTELGARLAVASRLIRSDFGVRVIYIPWGTFDTHDNQEVEHTALLQELDAALGPFLDEISSGPDADQVLVATASEFGRRVPENDSGTDHGGASSMLLWGAVNAGIHGDPPPLDRLDKNDNLVATTNFRDYYATLAEEWLGVPATEVLPTGATPITGILA